MTYQDILDAESAIGARPGTEAWTLREDINQILAAVEDNSQEDASRFEDIRFLLSAPEHAVSRAWFAAFGLVP